MKKIFHKYGLYFVPAFLLLAAYFLTRFYNLTDLQIFTDEAIYIRWSQIGAQDANWRFISLTDGKQPLFTWIMMILFKLGKGFDPLFIGRTTSVLSGLLSIIGIWFLTYELFRNLRMSFISSFLYLIIPFSLMYDRVALYDSLVAALYIWSLYLSILLVRKRKLDIALILGFVLGAGMLNKTSGFISLYLLPFTLLLFDFKNQKWKSEIVKWTLLAALSALVSQVLYSVLKLSPFSHIIAEKNTLFVYPLSEWLYHPFRFLLGNLNGLFDWTINYLTKPIFLMSILGLASLWSKPKEKLLLFIYWFLPLFGLALFGKVLYPRFVLFMAMPLIVSSALAFDKIWRTFRDRQYVAVIIFTLTLSVSVSTSYKVITDPYRSNIPNADKGQFMDNYFAGGGIRESVQFFSRILKNGPLTVYTEGTFGLLPYALEIYLVDDPNITIKGIWPLPKVIPQEMIDSAMQQPTYLILNETQTIPLNWPLEFIALYQKGSRTDIALRIMKIIPEKEIASIK